MRFLRWLAAALCLHFGAIDALLAWNMTTCTQGAADSLYSVILVLPFYLTGWLLLPKRGNGFGLLATALVPIIITTYVTCWTISLTSGISACALITGDPHDMDGREQTFVMLWGLACLVFWLGLAISLKMANWLGANSVERA